MPPSPSCSAQLWITLVPPHPVPWSPYKDGLCLEAPCSHKVGSWSHHLVDDVEDPGDDAEDPGDGAEALVDDGEALMGWRSINDPLCGHSCFDGVMVP